MDCPENQYSFKPPSHPVVGRFRAHNHPGGAVFWGHREGGREGGMRKVGVRVLEGRKVGGCRRKEGRRE